MSESRGYRKVVPVTEKANKKKYTSVEQMQAAVDAYFDDCEGRPLTDENGEVVLNKNGSPVIVGAHPPTVTGLALWLGFGTRLELLDDRNCPEKYRQIMTAAKSRCEEYAESRLYDRDGVSGAKFSLANNFKGWDGKSVQERGRAGTELPGLYKALTEENVRSEVKGKK